MRSGPAGRMLAASLGREAHHVKNILLPLRRRHDALAEATAAFVDRYPAYRATCAIDTLRASEYRRFDAQNHAYLDYTGGGVYAESQLRRHRDLLDQSVLGNPHSNNRASRAMTALVEQARARVAVAPGVIPSLSLTSRPPQHGPPRTRRLPATTRGRPGR